MSLTVRYWGLVSRDASGNEVLAEANGRLPHYTRTNWTFWQGTTHFIEAIHQKYELELIVHRCVGIFDQPDGSVDVVYAGELRHAPAPHTLHWVTELAHGQPWLAQWQQEQGQGPAWYQFGWWRRIPQLAQAQQIRSWERSAVFRLPDGTFFKAMPAMFWHDAQLMQQFASTLPFAPMLEVNEAQNWVIMADVGTSLEGKESPLPQAMAEYARLQMGLTAHLSELESLGVWQRPLHQFIDDFQALIADTNALQPEPTASLTLAEIVQLKMSIPIIQKWLTELQSYPIPSTLEHGDLFTGQMMVKSGVYTFLDWSDSSITHPFFSLFYFLHEAEWNDKTIKTKLVETFLTEWQKTVPIEILRLALPVSQKLAPLHFALLYHRHILPNMQFKWEMHRMIPYYLRLLLSHLP